MGKKVKIRTLVSMAGPNISLAGGDIYEVDEHVAIARIAAGLAEPVDNPGERQGVNRAGQPLETAALAPPEQRSEPSQVLDAMLSLLPDVSAEVVQALTEAGYDSIDELAAAEDDELKAVAGVGPATLKKIRAAVAAWFE